MLLLAYFSLLVLAKLGATRVLNITGLGPSIKPIPASLNLHPIPNPFPVPNTDITLDFAIQPVPGPPLPKTDVIECFVLAKGHLETLIHSHGDQPIPYSYELVYGQVAVKIYSHHAPFFCITYSEAVSVLLGISLKMAREGYEFRLMRVLQTEFGDILGEAVVRRAFL